MTKQDILFYIFNFIENLRWILINPITIIAAIIIIYFSTKSKRKKKEKTLVQNNNKKDLKTYLQQCEKRGFIYGIILTTTTVIGCLFEGFLIYSCYTEPYGAEGIGKFGLFLGAVVVGIFFAIIIIIFTVLFLVNKYNTKTFKKQLGIKKNSTTDILEATDNENIYN